jgi:hypothetical protein
MLARVLFLLSFIVLSKRAFVLELTETIELYPRETVVVDSPYRENSKNMWVVGRFPSHKIVPLEGRLGDRFSEKKTRKGLCYKHEALLPVLLFLEMNFMLSFGI